MRVLHCSRASSEEKDCSLSPTAHCSKDESPPEAKRQRSSYTAAARKMPLPPQQNGVCQPASAAVRQQRRSQTLPRPTNQHAAQAAHAAQLPVGATREQSVDIRGTCSMSGQPGTAAVRQQRRPLPRTEAQRTEANRKLPAAAIVPVATACEHPVVIRGMCSTCGQLEAPLAPPKKGHLTLKCVLLTNQLHLRYVIFKYGEEPRLEAILSPAKKGHLTVKCVLLPSKCIFVYIFVNC